MKCDETHASAAMATNKSRQTPLCRCEVLQIIKLIDCVKDLTASKNKTKQKPAKTILDHRRCPVVSFSHQIYDLLRVGLDKQIIYGSTLDVQL